MVLQPGNALSGLVALDVASGKQNCFSPLTPDIVQRPVWMPDQSGLLAQSSLGHRSDCFRFLPRRKVARRNPRYE